MKKRTRLALIALAIVALAISGGVAVFALSGSSSDGTRVAGESESEYEAEESESEAEGEGDLGGGALAEHLEALREAVPGNGGEDEEGPWSAAEDAYLARAFPDTVISLRDAAAARSAAAAQRGRPFPRGKGRKGTWISIGPSRALYPHTEYRNAYSYVPNKYVAGGRTTAIAIADTCKPGDCRVYVTPAGGGVWTTKNALANTPGWDYLGGPLGINAAGSITIDPNDPSGKTIYVGTGEANICGSGCVAGVGVYKSTDGGQSWTGPLGGPATDQGNPLAGKGVAEILVKPGSPNTLYVATTTALRGMSEVCCSGVTRPVPGAAKWGLYKSTNGGATWSFIHNGSADPATCTGTMAEFQNAGTCSPRGVRDIALDPNDASGQTIYAASYARGIWRSEDGGASWTQIKPSLNAAVIQTRAAIAVTKLPGGATRMYVYEGNIGNPYSRLFRSDNANGAAPVFTDLTSPSTAAPGYAWYNMCGGQCWYDMFVHTPKGHPDIVYAGGSYVYGETIANKRAVVLSRDAGVSGTDMTFDGTNELHPNGLHPDQHALVTNPGNPLQFFETNDGGIMRSSGDLVNRSDWCDDPNRALVNPVDRERCRQMLSAIPSRLDGLNEGLTTLQWIKLTSSPHNVGNLQGGTQDNGTWETNGNPIQWENTMIGDGGWNGWDVENRDFRFHSFFDVSPEVNFDRGDIGEWIWVSDPIFGHPGSQFYSPIISDPVTTKWMFAGTGLGVYRTKTHGLGTMSYEEAQERCNTWTGTFAAACGDWVKIDQVALNSAGYGADKAGGAISAVERTKADTTTAWAATTTGRVFITKNVGAEPASAVTWTRLDDDYPVSPNRFVSSIWVNSTNANEAWVSYSGYEANDPGRPGHMFRVVYNPATGTSTWTDISYDWGDLPATDLVRDDVTGDVYAASDFGVSVLKNGTATWVEPATGMPAVEVASLEIRADERILYAATHGLSAWRLNLN